MVDNAVESVHKRDSLSESRAGTISFSEHVTNNTRPRTIDTAPPAFGFDF